MSNKADLRAELNNYGYQLGPFASKETLSNIIRLHSIVLAEKNINVGQLDDSDLRKYLIDYGYLVGPVTNHTRTIYQRQLLEVLTNESTEGGYESDQSSSDTNDENRLYPDLSKEKPFSYGLRETDEPVILKNYYKKQDTNVRARIPTKINEDLTLIDEKSLVEKKNSGTTLYAGITIMVAMIIFVFYFWFEN